MYVLLNIEILGIYFQNKVMYQRGDISRPNFWIIRKLTWKWLHRELGIIEKKCGYKMCSSNSTGRKHCKMIIKKQKIAFIDLLKKQTINKNKSLHFIFFLIGAKINFQCLSLKLEIIYIEGELNE